MSRLPLLFCLMVALALGVSETAFAKRLALVIGNSKYEHVPALKNPANDATLMAASLEKVGFEVTLLKDQDQRGMKSALLAFGRKLKKGADAGLIYYAGHGIEVNGRNFLVPVDSNTQSEQEADISNVDLNDLMALMENSGVPFNILVLDACRNNPFRGFRSQRGGLAPVNAPVGTYIAYSTAPGTVAADGDGDNSPFTQALSEQLATPGLTIESVFKNTRSAVRKISDGQQVPFDSSAIEGDFFFKAALEPEPVIAPEPPPPIPEPTAEELNSAFLAKAATAWSALEKSKDPKAFEAFLETYKDTPFATLAQDRLEKLTAKAAPAPVVEPVVTPPPPVVAPEPTAEELKNAFLAKAATAWSALDTSEDPEAYEEFLKTYKDTPFATLAQDRLEKLTAKAAPPPVVETVVTPPPPLVVEPKPIAPQDVKPVEGREPEKPALTPEVATVTPSTLPIVSPQTPIQAKEATPEPVKLPKKVVAPAIKKNPAKRQTTKKARVKKPVVKRAVAAKKRSGSNCFTFDGQRVCD